VTAALSKKQRSALEAVRSSSEPLDGVALARRLDTSPESAHQTMASLVRRGLVRKGKVRGAIRYEAVAS
jgi:DNA-binding IclR family transcriptional regulator